MKIKTNVLLLFAEVKIMENEQFDTPISEEKKEIYKPRPLWQIIAAWVGIAIVAISFIM